MNERTPWRHLGLLIVAANVLAVMALAAESQSIGQVTTLQGAWCRKATHLQVHDPIYLDDDIHYCSAVVGQHDRIVIRFDRNPLYYRPYECSTPGICDQQAGLWLRGAYQYGELAPGKETELISALKFRHSLVPDSVIAENGRETRLPANVAAQLTEGTYSVCHISRRLEATNCMANPVSRYQPVIDGGPGIYGIYRISDLNGNPTRHRLPRAVLVITPANSVLGRSWDLVPKTFQNSSDAYSVFERWRFLVHSARSFLNESQ